MPIPLEILVLCVAIAYLAWKSFPRAPHKTFELDWMGTTFDARQLNSRMDGSVPVLAHRVHPTATQEQRVAAARQRIAGLHYFHRSANDESFPSHP